MSRENPSENSAGLFKVTLAQEAGRELYRLIQTLQAHQDNKVPPTWVLDQLCAEIQGIRHGIERANQGLPDLHGWEETDGYE